MSVHGHARGGELRQSVAQGAANVVENHGRIAEYSTGIGFFSHAVAETNDDLAVLIGVAHSVDGPGLLLPLRNTELLHWCLERGLRVVHTDESHEHRAVSRAAGTLFGVDRLLNLSPR
jgi:hypothetical protein